MSSTSQYSDFSDLYTGLLNIMRLDTTQTATVTQAKRYINIALQDMHLGTDLRFPTPWAERRDVIRTHPRYNTGTVAVTQGSQTITGSSTLWNTANAWSENNMRANIGKVTLGGSPEVYDITAVASDTSATIADGCIDEVAAASAYDYFEDEYALATDFSNIVSATSFDVGQEVRLMDRTLFRTLYPRNRVPGKPKAATLIALGPSSDATIRNRVRFAPPPDLSYLYQYIYLTTHLAVSSSGTTATALSSDADEPIVPLKYRHCIIFHAAYHWYINKKNDARADTMKAEYTDIMLRTQADIGISDRRVRLQPAVGHYRRSASRPYGMRSRGTKFDFNGEWDRLIT